MAGQYYYSSNGVLWRNDGALCVWLVAIVVEIVITPIIICYCGRNCEAGIIGGVVLFIVKWRPATHVLYVLKIVSIVC